MDKSNLIIAVLLVIVTVLASVFMKWDDLANVDKGIYFPDQAT